MNTRTQNAVKTAQVTMVSDVPKKKKKPFIRKDVRNGFDWEEKKLEVMADQFIEWALQKRKIGDKRGVRIAAYENFYSLVLRLSLKTNMYLFQAYGDCEEDIESSHLDRLVNALLDNIKDLK